MAFTLTHPDQVVLLDLDGTLTKSEEGILAAARYAYKCAGKSIPDPETLQTFVGPALVESFSKYGFSQDELPQAVADSAVPTWGNLCSTTLFTQVRRSPPCT